MSLARVFGSVAELYDDARPPYPDRMLDLVEDALGGFGGARVLDIAAGTGMAARPLAARGARVVAVEPDANLLQLLVARSPGVAAVGAVAEQLPFRASCADVVTCATAWHWLDAAAASAEVARVLRPSGWLAIWWANNQVDRSIEWEAAQAEVYDRWSRLPGSWPERGTGVRPSGAGADLRDRGWDVRIDTAVEWTREAGRDEHLAMLATHSIVIALGPRKQEFLDEVAGALEPWPRLTERLRGEVVVAQPPGGRRR